MAVTLSGWRSHASLRGNEAPADADDDLANPALVRAGDYIEHRYVANLRAPYTAASLEALVDKATYEAASLELATPSFFTKTFTPSQQKVLTQVDAIKWTSTGSASGTYAEFPTSTLIDAMFEPYINDRDGPSFGVWSLTRAC